MDCVPVPFVAFCSPQNGGVNVPASRTSTRAHHAPPVLKDDTMRLKTICAKPPEHFLPVGQAINDAGLDAKHARLYERFFGQKTVARIGSDNLLSHLQSVAEEALQTVDRDRVKHVIYTHTVAHCIPAEKAPLAQLQNRLGLNHAHSFALNQLNCTTGLYALHVAQKLLARHDDDAKALIISGEAAAPKRNTVINNVIVMGENATATLVDKSADGAQVLAAECLVIGRFYAGIDLVGDLKREYDSLYIPSMTSVITTALRKADVHVDDVDVVIPHNVNAISWRGVLDASGIPHEKLYGKNIATHGHCFTADPYLNLHSYLADNPTRRESQIALLCSSGIGSSYGCVVVKLHPTEIKDHA